MQAVHIYPALKLIYKYDQTVIILSKQGKFLQFNGDLGQGLASKGTLTEDINRMANHAQTRENKKRN